MNGVTLFASGGIGDLALRQAGVDVVVANELIHERAEVFKYNFPECEMIVGNIWELQGQIINTVEQKLKGAPLDFLMATPPCQGMSKNGRGKLLSLIRQGVRPELDQRNQLIVPTINIVKALLPKVVVLENVPEMKDTLISVNDNLVNIIEFVKSSLQPLGYVGRAEVVEFADYGVPQRRQRLITIFSREDKMVEYYQRFFSFIPKQTHKQNPINGYKPWVTLRDAISKTVPLDAVNQEKATSSTPFHYVPVFDKDKYFWVSNTPPEQGAFDNQCVKCDHQHNSIHGATKDINGVNRANENTPIRCNQCDALLPRPWVVHKDEYRIMKGYTSAYRRMKWDSPANALTTNLSYACSDSKIHPDQNRVLSLHEAFIVHTIDHYNYQWKRFDGKKVSDKLIREIIGESIPPKGLEYILTHVIEIYRGKVKHYNLKNDQMRLFQEKEHIQSLSEAL